MTMVPFVIMLTQTLTPLSSQVSCRMKMESMGAWRERRKRGTEMGMCSMIGRLHLSHDDIRAKDSDGSWSHSTSPIKNKNASMDKRAYEDAKSSNSSNSSSLEGGSSAVMIGSA